MNKFILPAIGNSITQKDIEKYILRITVDFKEYFPSKNSIVDIWIDDRVYNIKYTVREGRSSLLKLGKEVIKHLKLNAGGRLKFEKIPIGGFRISLI